MPEEKFKLPLSSYEELVKIIKAYGHFSEPANLEEVSKLIGLHTTIISRNAGFMITTGILQAGAKKLLMSEGRELAQALEHDMPDVICSRWRKIVLENDFLSKLLSAIRIRNGMDEDTLEAHIAYSAGQPKKPQFMTGARTVVDILRAAKLIKEMDGKITAMEIGEPEKDKTRPLTRQEERLPQTQVPLPPVSPAAGIQVNVQLNINCTADDLEGLGEKLKSVIDQISGRKETDSNGQ